jgi:hypothetical protein
VNLSGLVTPSGPSASIWFIAISHIAYGVSNPFNSHRSGETWFNPSGKCRRNYRSILA